MTETASSAGEQVKDRAADAAGQAQEKAQQAAGQAREQVRSQIDQRSTDAGRRISEQGSDLRTVGDQLRQQGKDGPAKLADRAAEQVEKAGGWLTESDADRILHDVESVARRNPWAVVAGGMALGFVASRFLKASSSDRYRSSIGSPQSSPYQPPALPPMTTPDEPRFAADRLESPGTGIGTGTGTGTPGVV
ncbi:MAG: hypothetical protein QOC54_3413 [Baekduia sp.]|nr:hypothetical protein [Baekduia sp.]